MKTLTVFLIIIGFLSYNSYTFAELTVDDLEKIQKLLDKLEERMNKRFTDEVQVINDKITDQGEHSSENMKTMERHLRERLEYLGTLIIALIVSIIGFVSVPMGLITYQYLKFRSRQDEEIKVLREKIQELETKVLAENRSQIIQ